MVKSRLRHHNPFEYAYEYRCTEYEHKHEGADEGYTAQPQDLRDDALHHFAKHIR